MGKTIIKNGTIVNDGEQFVGSIVIDGECIESIIRGELPEAEACTAQRIVDATGKWVLPGAIDDQVHFREPGLTHKAEIATESVAAVAGGVTSFMDMPNTLPQTTTLEALEWKYERAAQVSPANYSFYIGATNDNFEVLRQTDFTQVCGVKIFMGSSTGNMLVDNEQTLRRIFAEIPALIAVHCEEESIIQANKKYYTERFGNDLPIFFHPLIRSAEACYASSSRAAELASQYGTRLHLLHLSTAREMSLLDTAPLAQKRITGEVCVHHLWFDDNDYAQYGNRIKWNPAVKTCGDRKALLEALRSGKLDVVATDHAPHLWSEKQGSCLKAASGGPLVQHSLQVMLELAQRGEFPLELVVEKMCHAPALLYRIDRRGYLRPGYYADVVVVDPHKPYTVTRDNILSKCGWSPFEGHTFPATIERTFVNGNEVFAEGKPVGTSRGKRLTFHHTKVDRAAR